MHETSVQKFGFQVKPKNLTKVPPTLVIRLFSRKMIVVDKKSKTLNKVRSMETKKILRVVKGQVTSSCKLQNHAYDERIFLN